MADSSVSSSRSWITNLVIFDSLLNANIPNYDNLDCCVTPEAKIGVLRGLKQLNYWRDKLQSLVSQHIVIFSCMTFSGIAKPDLCDLKMQITKLIGKGRILSIYYPENTNFIGFLFQEAGEAQIVRQGVTHIAGAPVCFVDKKENNEHFIRLLWTPYNCPLENVMSALDKFCSKVTVEFEKTRFEDGDIVPSNILSGSIVLRDGVTLNTLPHILKVSGVTDQYILLVVKGRPPICLRCRRVGHIRRQCPDRKCFKCLSLHASDVLCKVRSYASVTKNNISLLEEDMVVNEGLDYPNDCSAKDVLEPDMRDVLVDPNKNFAKKDFKDNSSKDTGSNALMDFDMATTKSESEKKNKRVREGEKGNGASGSFDYFSKAVEVPDLKKKKMITIKDLEIPQVNGSSDTSSLSHLTSATNILADQPQSEHNHSFPDTLTDELNVSSINYDSIEVDLDSQDSDVSIVFPHTITCDCGNLFPFDTEPTENIQCGVCNLLFYFNHDTGQFARIPLENSSLPLSPT